MAKKVKFALKMEDGAEVRSLDELKAHFDIGSVVRDFFNGDLLTWLEDRYYDEEADAIKKISPDDEFVAQKLCKIFDKESPEEIARRRERLERLKKYTSDEKILANVDQVAFDQEDLADLLDEDVKEIFLCANRFIIPLRMKNKNYIGVGEAVAVIRRKEPVDFSALNITFKNISFDDDYQKIFDAQQAAKKIQPPVHIKVSGNRAEAIVKFKNYTLHERLASMLVQKASSFDSEILLGSRGNIVNAKNISMLMIMNLVRGTEIKIIAIGSDAQEAVKTLTELIDSKFGEH